MLTSGPITRQTSPIIMTCDQVEQIHVEVIPFRVINAPQFRITLGMPWLTLHNPGIDWAKRSVNFSSTWCKQVCCKVLTGICRNTSCYSNSRRTRCDVPLEYQDIMDVFTESRAEALAPHRAFDCKIDLVPGAKIPCSRIYALTEQENLHLRSYLDKYLQKGFSCSLSIVLCSQEE